MTVTEYFKLPGLRNTSTHFTSQYTNMRNCIMKKIQKTRTQLWKPLPLKTSPGWYEALSRRYSVIVLDLWRRVFLYEWLFYHCNWSCCNRYDNKVQCLNVNANANKSIRTQKIKLLKDWNVYLKETKTGNSIRVLVALLSGHFWWKYKVGKSHFWVSRSRSDFLEWILSAVQTRFIEWEPSWYSK